MKEELITLLKECSAILSAIPSDDCAGWDDSSTAWDVLSSIPPSEGVYDLRIRVDEMIEKLNQKPQPK